MKIDQCRVCRRPQSDECGCSPLLCPVCDKAVSWFGESYGMNPCDHVVVWGTVGEKPVWEKNEVREAFLAYGRRRRKCDVGQDEIEAYAKFAKLVCEEHDDGRVHGQSTGTFVVFDIPLAGRPSALAADDDEYARVEEALSSGRRQPVLVDTAGRAPSDGSSRELFTLIANRRDVRTHLVLAADTPVATARKVFETYEDARPTRLVLTKLDEAGSLAPLVGLLRDRQLPISYLGTGQRVPEDLARATAQLLATSVLGEQKPFTHLHS